MAVACGITLNGVLSRSGRRELSLSLSLSRALALARARAWLSPRMSTLGLFRSRCAIEWWCRNA